MSIFFYLNLGVILNSAIDYDFEIHLGLKKLMDLKKNRDGKDFTIYQLAKAINMPHSIIVKLLHNDPKKRVVNPRIDTLSKIIDFFKSDGFSVTLDDLIFGSKEIEINDSLIKKNLEDRNIEIFSFRNIFDKIGTIDIQAPKELKNLVAFLSEEEISPLFKKGSVFIIDLNSEVENDSLVAVKMKNNVLIKKIIQKNELKILNSIKENEKEIIYNPMAHNIIGSVIQIFPKM